MASIGDCGMKWDIHPKNKLPVGERLALLAQGHVYGEDLLCDAPEFEKVEKEGNDLIISFLHSEGLHISGEKLQEMQVETADGERKDITEVRIQDEKLILPDCADVKKIFFAWTDYYEENLYNRAGIPAKPFVCEV